MSGSIEAIVYVGVKLSEEAAMDRFGAKYVEDIRGVCPKDDVPNTDGRKFCGDCGGDLRFQRKTAEGISELYELEESDMFDDSGLDVYELSKYCNGENGVIFGKKLVSHNDVTSGGSVSSLPPDLATTVNEVRENLKREGIEGSVELHLITYVSY